MLALVASTQVSTSEDMGGRDKPDHDESGVVA